MTAQASTPKESEAATAPSAGAAKADVATESDTVQAAIVDGAPEAADDTAPAPTPAKPATETVSESVAPDRAKRSSAPEPPPAPARDQRTDSQSAAGETAKPAPHAVEITALPQHVTATDSRAAAADVATATQAQTTGVTVANLPVEIAARVQSGRSRFEIRLEPPELGRVDVSLDFDRNGQVTSRLVVERVETLDLLRRDAAQLERAFQDAGLKMSDSSLQFTLRDQGFADRGEARAATHVVVQERDSISTEPERITYGRAPRPGGGVDIRV
jgi:flagellar hook-length control protein FliK